MDTVFHPALADQIIRERSPILDVDERLAEPGDVDRGGTVPVLDTCGRVEWDGGVGLVEVVCVDEDEADGGKYGGEGGCYCGFARRGGAGQGDKEGGRRCMAAHDDDAWVYSS